MIQMLLQIAIFLSIGVILAFGVGTWLHMSMHKDNKEAREKALKVNTDEPSE